METTTIRVIESKPQSTPGKPKRKSMQFSQKICVFCMCFVVAVWIGNFVLLFLGREQISDAVSIGFSVFGGFVTGGYFTLCGVRDCSMNKLKGIEYECERNDVP